MNSPLWVKFVLITVIPTNSLLLSKDMADVVRRTRVYPNASEGTTNPNEYEERHYSDHFCTNEKEVDWDIWEIWRRTDNNLFEVGSHRPEGIHQGFREFRCTDGVIENLDHETDDTNSRVVHHTWWINAFWKQLVSGECAATAHGSHRLYPPLPKEYFAHFFPCITHTDEVLLEKYDDTSCTDDKFLVVLESRRMGNAGGTCIDVARHFSHRYNNRFVCERHALVEKYYEGHHCEGAIVDHEVIWPFYKWKMWVRGECTPMFNTWAFKFNKPMYDESVIKEISKLPCADVMALLTTYKDSGCHDVLSNLELVDKDLGTDCIHVSSWEHKRQSTKHCITAGDSVKMAVFDSEDCSGNFSESFYVGKNMYTFLNYGICVEGKNMDGTAIYFRMSLPDSYLFQFPTLSPCET